MRKIALVIFACFIMQHLTYAQKAFYWYKDQQIELIPDSSSIYVEVETTAEPVENVKNNLAAVFKINDSSIHHLSDSQFVIQSGKILNNAEGEKQSNIKYQTPLLKHNQATLFILPRIILQLRSGIKIEALLSSFRSEFTSVDSIGYDRYLLQIVDRNNYQTILQLTNKLHDQTAMVLWAEPEFYSNARTTTDPLYPNQYYLKNTGQGGGTVGMDIKAEPAWSISTGSNTVRVAVVDQGVEAHEEFTGRIASGYTIGGGTGTPQNGTKAHGMLCAGIIGASHNNLGIQGVAPNIMLVPVNICPLTGVPTNPDGFGTNVQIAAAIDWAWNASQGNAHILSCSWEQAAPSSDVDAAVLRARTLGRSGKGCAVVFSSGNWEGVPPYYPGVLYPNSNAGVITVGAISKTGALQSYSRYGPSMDLVAPSGEILGDIVTTDRMGSAGLSSGNYYSAFNGTSAACPQAAGAAALMLSVNANLTETDVRTILQSTATDMGPAGFDDGFGYGRLNTCLAVASSYAKTLSIAGNFTVCTSSSYTVTLPAGFTPIWSASGKVAISGSNTANPVTVTKTGNGTGTLSVSFTSSCGVVAGPTKNLYAGLPIFPAYTTSPNPMCQGEDATITFTLPSGQTITAATGNQGGIQVPLSGVGNSYTLPGDVNQIILTIQNSCGTANITKLLLKSSCNNSMLQVSPNPANNELYVTDLSANINNSQNAGNKIAQLISRDGIILETVKMNGAKANFKVSKIANGTYYLKVIDRNGIRTEQIIIKH